MTKPNDKYILREISEHELKNALDLVWSVFEEFEAPDYSPEGVKVFQDFISYRVFLDKLLSGNMEMYGCYDGTELLGVIALRDKLHISLLFVRRNYHKRGVASSLCYFIFAKCKMNLTDAEEITVNSSPFAVEFYHKLGFKDTSSEQTVNGIRFTPMKYKL